MSKKLSLSYRIEAANGSHIWFTQFCNLIPVEQEHIQATRAKMGGTQCARTEEFVPFIKRTRPDLVSFISEEVKQSFEELNLDIAI